MSVLCGLLVFLLVGMSALGAELHVPQQFSSIQSAIDASSDGDVIWVSPGEYVENIDFRGKAIRVASLGGASVTTIDGGGVSSVVTFKGFEGPESVLEGFTLVNGVGQSFAGTTDLLGGGVFCALASPTIRNNTFVANTANLGGAIACWPKSSARIVGNTIRENTATSCRRGEACGGGGIFIDGCDGVVIRSNTITENLAFDQAGAILVVSSTNVTVIRNRILSNDGRNAVLVDRSSEIEVSSNEFSHSLPESSELLQCVDTHDIAVRRNRFLGPGTAIAFNTQASGRITACLFLGGANAIKATGEASLTILNSAMMGQGNENADFSGLFIADGSRVWMTNCTIAGGRAKDATIEIRDSMLTVTNCIIWGNEAPTQIASENSHVALTHTNIEGGWAGDGNLDTDPFLVSVNDDWHLQLRSPCIDVGLDNGELGETDLDGDPRIQDGNGDATPAPDMGADELLVEVAARYGTVVAKDGSAVGVLLANGEIGDARRELELVGGEEVVIEALPTPQGPNPSLIAIYAWSQWPTVGTLSPQPYDLGLMVFPTPLNVGNRPRPRQIWNSLGHYPLLGVPTQGAPTVPNELFRGTLGPGTRATLQGFIYDLGTPRQVAITNALLLAVE